MSVNQTSSLLVASVLAIAVGFSATSQARAGDALKGAVIGAGVGGLVDGKDGAKKGAVIGGLAGAIKGN